MHLKVSENKRFLVKEDNTPFFYLADTAWELFHRLTLEEAKLYLDDRASKGFTVIQAVLLAEFNGLREPNRHGHYPLINEDPTRPNEEYFAHVDRVVAYAQSLGLVMGLLPTWGDKWNQKWGVGPEIFTPENARIYGELLGRRYKEAPVIWILGGDRPVETETHRAILRALAEGLAAGDGGNHLRTFHPPGVHSSTEYWPNENWLDFHMYQTGHSRKNMSWKLIAHDYEHDPTKPCLDGEPGYEDHSNEFDPNKGYMDCSDARRFAYWDVFSGACGHTYGCHPIWQFYNPELYEPITWARVSWKEALHLPGAGQMQFLRQLMETHPFLVRIPDPTLVLSPTQNPLARIVATRDTDGTYALLYLPLGGKVVVNPTSIRADRVRALWFDPRTGKSEIIGERSTRSDLEFEAPSWGPGNDWVLVIERVS